MSANECWNYHRYFRECDGQIVAPPPNDDEEGVEASRPGYGLLATEVTAVLRACPALTDLSIEINYLHNNGRTQYVNADLYGDEFWEAVADRCPRLETISMNDCSGYANFNIKSIETLTDRTLLLLAGMKQLRSVELAPARLTGEGIFEYLRCVSKESETVGEERSIEIRLGGHQRTPLAPPRFYAEIVTFLRLLSEISEEELGAATCRQKPEIYIKNPYESKVDRIWCEPFMRDSLMPALEAVQAKHPSLGLGVWLFGRKGNVFSRIDFICLKWCPKSEFDRQLFHEWAEEDAERDTYRDARMYEAISDDDGHYEENDGDDDDGDDNEISVQDLLLWRAIMARFTNEDER
ncbi:uncharacterized protein IUM83_19286 [Phytophthora cinnamomi]|uniref:uncharacterized protein n=1 Tax=Phytophthora cinnamomi TaxID=4785 RepID=UPI0035598781|nr:hypothetical protein IUM83_19286 [Phytophthora cinnamomi]